MSELVIAAGLVSPEDAQVVKDLLPSIQHDWQVKPVFRTETEARVSVLNTLHFPTPHLRYWQAVREQQVHFDELVRLSFAYRRLNIELAELTAKIKKAKGYKRELLLVDIDEKTFNRALYEKVAAERVREIKQWAKIKAEELAKDPALDTESADGVEQLKSYAEEFILEMFNSGNNIPPADAQNIVGKARTAMLECIRLGVWDDVQERLARKGITNDHIKQLGA